MKVYVGSSSTEMDDTEAAEKLRQHFAAHGVPFKRIVFEVDGTIHFTMSSGAPGVIIHPKGNGEYDVELF